MSRRDLHKKEIFSLRKLSVGLASVMIGSFFFLAHDNDVVHADEVKEPESAAVDQATLDAAGELANDSHLTNQISHDSEGTVASEAATPQSASSVANDEVSTASASAVSQSAAPASQNSDADELAHKEVAKNNATETTAATSTDANKTAEAATQTNSFEVKTASLLADNNNLANSDQLSESKAETNATDFSQYVDNANSMASIATSYATQADLSSATTALSNATSVANS
ncbi:MAG: YSIRK-type signal peptide-containing protein, partial [Lactobacillus sp.]|nr:YSIRK-type signal peptide-containing protein [Lactobacillus sp.]